MLEIGVITVLSFFAVYGMFEIIYTFLFSPGGNGSGKYIILDDIHNKKLLYEIERYTELGYKVYVTADKDKIDEYKKMSEFEKSEFIDRDIFVQYFKGKNKKSCSKSR